MNRINIKSALVSFIALIISLPLAAWATDVDYDAVDEAALPMVAQTDILQASDQFVRAYHQLLVYDHEEFSGDYNYQNLVGSITASSVVLFVEGEGADYGFWLGSLAGYSQLNLGYDEESEKYLALADDNQPLSSGWGRIGAAYKSGWNGFLWCMLSGATLAVGAASVIINGVGAWLGGAVGPPLCKAAAIGSAIWTSICILVGVFHWWKTVFFGSMLVTLPRSYWRRRFVKQRRIQGVYHV